MSSYRASRRNSALATDDALRAVSVLTDIAAAHSVRYALAGGVAMHLYGFTRATKNVDFIASNGLPVPVVRVLSFGGFAYDVAVPGLAESVRVDWIVRNDDLAEVYALALDEAEETEEGFPIVSAEWLCILKMLAGRGKDEMDLRFLLRQPDLVRRSDVIAILRRLYGKAAHHSIESFKAECLYADVMRQKDDAGEV